MLNNELMEIGFPQEHHDVDMIHPDLVGLDLSQSQFHEVISYVHEVDATASFVYRLEHLNDLAKRNSFDLVKDVVTDRSNRVMEDGGTMHMYVSAPGAAAMANHTDTTDIFVLHLDGAKEWMLCEERDEAQDSYLTHKLDACTTYNEEEIETFKCETVTLYPGDGLFLPKRVVHSAMATSLIPSVHLTIAFPNDSDDDGGEGICMEPEEIDLELISRRRLPCHRDCTGRTAFRYPTGCDRNCNIGEKRRLKVLGTI